ncbi:hypothetical protein BH11PSE7_BH11PSE7_33100 [soil metagenome]
MLRYRFLLPALRVMSVTGAVQLLLLALPVCAQERATDVQLAPAFKFTTGLYSSSAGGGLGLDLNLRHTSDFGNIWLGWFRAPSTDTSQARVGWDRTFTLGPIRLQPSLQVASGGFLGGSAMVEAGETWFAGAGLGRTNLRNYVNLNFDPNDAWMLSGGYRWADNRSLALQIVHDNRQNPDQRHVHVVWRTPVADGDRLTVDLLAKSGMVGGTSIHRIGLTVGYDWSRTFIRVAWDPKVNFTPQDMLRLSAGVRF